MNKILVHIFSSFLTMLKKSVIFTKRKTPTIKEQDVRRVGFQPQSFPFSGLGELDKKSSLGFISSLKVHFRPKNPMLLKWQHTVGSQYVFVKVGQWALCVSSGLLMRDTEIHDLFDLFIVLQRSWSYVQVTTGHCLTDMYRELWGCRSEEAELTLNRSLPDVQESPYKAVEIGCRPTNYPPLLKIDTLCFHARTAPLEPAG